MEETKETREVQFDLSDTALGALPEADEDRFKFYLDDLLAFVFPTSMQHPLACARLFAFGLCGPLDDKGNIRTGFKGSRIVADYELNQMCLQFEKEDILCIYSKKAR